MRRPSIPRRISASPLSFGVGLFISLCLRYSRGPLILPCSCQKTAALSPAQKRDVYQARLWRGLPPMNFTPTNPPPQTGPYAGLNWCSSLGRPTSEDLDVAHWRVLGLRKAEASGCYVDGAMRRSPIPLATIAANVATDPVGRPGRLDNITQRLFDASKVLAAATSGDGPGSCKIHLRMRLESSGAEGCTNVDRQSRSLLFRTPPNTLTFALPGGNVGKFYRPLHAPIKPLWVRRWNATIDGLIIPGGERDITKKQESEGKGGKEDKDKDKRVISSSNPKSPSSGSDLDPSFCRIQQIWGGTLVHSLTSGTSVVPKLLYGFEEEPAERARLGPGSSSDYLAVNLKIKNNGPGYYFEISPRRPESSVHRFFLGRQQWLRIVFAREGLDQCYYFSSQTQTDDDNNLLREGTEARERDEREPANEAEEMRQGSDSHPTKTCAPVPECSRSGRRTIGALASLRSSRSALAYDLSEAGTIYGEGLKVEELYREYLPLWIYFGGFPLSNHLLAIPLSNTTDSNSNSDSGSDRTTTNGDYYFFLDTFVARTPPFVKNLLSIEIVNLLPPGPLKDLDLRCRSALLRLSNARLRRRPSSYVEIRRFDEPQIDLSNWARGEGDNYTAYIKFQLQNLEYSDSSPPLGLGEGPWDFWRKEKNNTLKLTIRSFEKGRFFRSGYFILKFPAAANCSIALQSGPLTTADSGKNPVSENPEEDVAKRKVIERRLKVRIVAECPRDKCPHRHTYFYKPEEPPSPSTATPDEETTLPSADSARSVHQSFHWMRCFQMRSSRRRGCKTDRFSLIIDTFLAFSLFTFCLIL